MPIEKGCLSVNNRWKVPLDDDSIINRVLLSTSSFFQSIHQELQVTDTDQKQVEIVSSCVPGGASYYERRVTRTSCMACLLAAASSFPF